MTRVTKGENENIIRNVRRMRARRERNEALVKMKLYGDIVPNQDPNTYTWW